MRRKWNDSWLTLPRGQRRAIVVLLLVVVMLCAVQWLTWSHRKHAEKSTTDYSVLEQEIELFRSQLDTIPVGERRPVYQRRTHARPDTTDTIRQQRSRKRIPDKPRRIEDVPRVEHQ